MKKNKNIIFCLVLSIILYLSFITISASMFIFNRFKNKEINLKVSPDLFKSSTCLLADNLFLDKKMLSNCCKDKSSLIDPKCTSEFEDLKKDILSLCNNHSELKPGIFIWDFKSNQYVDINANNKFPTASIIKIPILFQLFKRYDLNMVSFKEEMTITNYYKTGGSGMIQYQQLGTKYNICELTKLMIQRSDNTATNMLLSKIGGVNDLNRCLKKWGLAKTSIKTWLPDLTGSNVSTPKELGSMLYNIENKNFLSEQSRKLIINIMGHVKNKSLIHAGLKDGSFLIHKTGNIGEMVGDAGIVVTPTGNKYIIVIMVKRPWNSFAAKQLIIDISKLTYEFFESHNKDFVD